jgi:hypothetical protein
VRNEFLNDSLQRHAMEGVVFLWRIDHTKPSYYTRLTVTCIWVTLVSGRNNVKIFPLKGDRERCSNYVEYKNILF